MPVPRRPPPSVASIPLWHRSPWHRHVACRPPRTWRRFLLGRFSSPRKYPQRILIHGDFMGISCEYQGNIMSSLCEYHEFMVFFHGGQTTMGIKSMPWMPIPTCGSGACIQALRQKSQISLSACNASNAGKRWEKVKPSS